jgi:2-haloacid dehalogenase
VVTAERAGAYKPRPEPYHYALEELAVAPEAVLFVAGSPNDPHRCGSGRNAGVVA